ncbi:Histidinol dehydrogenase [Buchnera aphidicola (Cinara pseudotaxifoliae)]|uniref:Histidinol dehydrogenase n=1 Tax=Buchnera aphidicola (Cinara pseudotaxifoliae) TaxID=655384 RepID=A0A451DGC2_9GAMM|nr:histidinol dehydrogenase [Buchnera aphidicola]VFP85664.1 Histidinol dehydrogenase [Buchnera aphidicola (Cinara pseudotaxifoliae)]
MLNMSNNIFYWDSLSNQEQNSILLRPKSKINNSLRSSVSRILKKVKKNGDSALHAYNLQFDKVKLDAFYIEQKKINLSSSLVSQSFKNAILIAKKNIRTFHSKQISTDLDVCTYPGVRCQHISRPINSVGLYVPKGFYPLVSTALMLSIPAQLAGCPNIVLCSPPPVSNELLYIAKICGIERVIQLGGAHAIAALAFGTNSIQKVDKIFGPGNVFVTEAKLQISQLMNPCVSIDMLAGPSEMLIISDKYSNPKFIASDLLAQLEHDNNSQVILVSTSKGLVNNVVLEIEKQMLCLTKKNIILCSLKNSKIIVTKSVLKCFEISNLYSPEHLMLHIKNSRSFLSHVKNAGSVFLGSWTPGAAGDYITGSNHVLPTYGFSNTYSSLCVSDFKKTITIQSMTKKSLQQLSKNIMVLSETEGMDAHSKSVSTRINHLDVIIKNNEST